MSLKPMEFENANEGHLNTWKRVCRGIAWVSLGLAVALLFLAFTLL